jgi:hypothetical protein
MSGRNQYFANAFWAGLAAPVSLFASTPTYVHYAAAFSVPQSFAQAGAQLGHAFKRYRDGTAGLERKPE